MDGTLAVYGADWLKKVFTSQKVLNVNSNRLRLVMCCRDFPGVAVAEGEATVGDRAFRAEMVEYLTRWMTVVSQRARASKTRVFVEREARCVRAQLMKRFYEIVIGGMAPTSLRLRRRQQM